MAGSKMWFGTLYETGVPGTSSTSVNARMQWVPAPDTGMGADSSGYSELLEFENGGANVVSSAATHRVYQMDWNVRQADGAGGLDIIKSYQQGIYGPGLIYFADPMNFTTNLFPPHWATPALSQIGWKPIAKAASYPSVAANIYNMPGRGFTSDPTAPLEKPTDPARFAVIPIPTGYTLHVCFRSGGGAGGLIAADSINLNGSYATRQLLTVHEAGTAPVYSFNSSQYKAVEFWVAGSVTNLVTSHAQLLPTVAATPSLSTAQYVPGAGHTGTRFTTEAIVETYVMAARQLKGMSASLTEVGAWQRAGT